MTQKEKELENKRIIEETLERGEELKEYYTNHSYKETIEYFNIKSYKLLKKILILLNYDFNLKKDNPVTKGKPSSRSHESYIEGGKKSGQTQRENWNNKSDKEREEWSLLMKESHGEEFKQIISSINKEYYNNLSKEAKEEIKLKQSKASKDWWNSLSKEEKKSFISNNIEKGAGWNHEKIKQTLKDKYGVENISQLDSVKKQSRESMNKTCLEKYGVMWNCMLDQCKNSIGSKGTHTKANDDFASLLDSFDIEYEREFSLVKYIYDFKINNTLIEINPSATHNSTFGIHGDPKSKNYHQEKTIYAIDNGYRCIHIFDWDDISKIIQLLRPRQTIGARQCKIKEVSKVEAMDFINEHHLQGYARDTIRLGLYYKEELVSIMTFAKPRYNKHYEYELIRYCSSYNVIGGAHKLFKHFLENYRPQSIITYCDTSKFTGEVYNELGFTLLRKGKPSKHWYNIKTGEHYTDNLIRQQGFSRIVNHIDASKDNVQTNENDELMIEHGFVEVYDSGQDTYVYAQ